jgi:hypothetical protein
MTLAVALLLSLLPRPSCAQADAGKRYEPCVYPNKCGPGEKRKDQPAPVPELNLPADPIYGQGDIVSAVRLGPGRIRYRRISDLQDAPAGLSLPKSKLPKQDKAKAASEKTDWGRIDSKGPAAGQANGMSEERHSTDRAGMDRMWGDAKRPSKPD